MTTKQERVSDETIHLLLSYDQGSLPGEFESMSLDELTGILKELQAYRAVMPKVMEALKQGHNATIWFFQGPHGTPPDFDDALNIEKVILFLNSTFGTKNE